MAATVVTKSRKTVAVLVDPSGATGKAQVVSTASSYTSGVRLIGEITRIDRLREGAIGLRLMASAAHSGTFCHRALRGSNERKPLNQGT
jgi:hypothetical protein